jgi:two-component system, LytTR family, sensor histidine kinase AlgZ
VSAPALAAAAPRPVAGTREARPVACYLPDFCQPRMVLAVVLIAELVAIVLTLARRDAVLSFWLALATASLFLLWCGLVTAALLCAARRGLARLDAPRLTVASFAIMLATTLALSEATYWLGRMTLSSFGTATDFFPTHHLSFVLGNLAIASIISALLLRYFYVTHQWRMNVEMEARSRVAALHARIRPHFLFNSMNTIASLTRTNPELAEQAVEDLADLFRASIGDAGHQIELRDELEMARVYQRIEQLRLGHRLAVDWRVHALPEHALIPALTVQPLLENAIYHGIEPRPEGGTVTVTGEREGDMLYISVSNPLPPGEGLHRHEGNRMALANIRERLLLACGQRARLAIEPGTDTFRVTLAFPLREQGA